MRNLLLLTSAIFLLPAARAQQVSKVKITILSTMLADLHGVGEWGFSALVEEDGNRILFDVGGRPTTVRDNAQELKLDLGGIQQVILSHNHFDHTAGLPAIRQRFPDGKTGSMAYIGSGFFQRDSFLVGMRIADSLAYVGSGGRFVVVDRFMKIAPGVWITGPIPRKYPAEKNYPRNMTIKVDGRVSEDIVAEDMSMVIETGKGLILLTGCGHAGLVNIMDYVQQQFPGQKITAVVGGIHLLDAADEQVAWTAGKLKEAGVQYFLGTHCTGINATYRIRELTGLSKTTCLYGGVGTSFDLDKGIAVGWLK
jgi:7,8-dihydropterin-6-yl-methyl-4-(beta-D-ribofuranosyl)aminobenzene 5'-phosphate synthase